MRIIFPDLIVAGGIALAATIPLSRCQEAHGAEPQSKTLTALENFPVNQYDRNEPKAARKLRLAQIARAIDGATSKPWERALLLSVGWYESNYRSHVQNCDVLGDKGKAVGLWQTWALECPATVDEQAQEAIRHLRMTMNFCKGKTLDVRIQRGVSLYATGKRCSWPGASRRLNLWRRVVRWM